MSFLLMYGTDEVFYAALVTATASACTALGRGTCRRCRAQTLSALACCRRLEQSTCLWTKPWQVGPGQGPHQEDSGRAAENFCVESAISFLTHALANLAGKNQLLIKLKITSFLPLMKMHFIFKGFSIQSMHLQFFSEMLLGCGWSVEFTRINLNVWNVPTDLLHSIGKKVQAKYFSQYCQNWVYFDTGMREGISGLAKAVEVASLYWEKLKSK